MKSIRKVQSVYMYIRFDKITEFIGRSINDTKCKTNNENR
jgi:hypothetical protein